MGMADPNYLSIVASTTTGLVFVSAYLVALGYRVTVPIGVCRSWSPHYVGLGEIYPVCGMDWKCAQT
jgi:hypothetical protein